ncbi:MAG: hypothetical protein GXP58_04910 [Deltaproteobacteria bacterium]|nr:hypothetical protein [Deltaproteobacteria bacterium]
MLNSVSSDSNILSSVSTNGKEEATLEKDQFLKILVAQMKYQDPMNPVQGTDFTNQLAQFSSLEQLIQVNSNLGSVQSGQKELGELSMSNYLGKHVLSKGSEISVTDGTPAAASYDLQGTAASGTLTVFDEEGSIVRIIDLGKKAPGRYDVTWDGKDMQGNLVSDGMYRFQTDFYDAEGGYVSSESYQTGKVQRIIFQDGVASFDLGNTQVPVESVVEVY